MMNNMSRLIRSICNPLLEREGAARAGLSDADFEKFIENSPDRDRIGKPVPSRGSAFVVHAHQGRQRWCSGSPGCAAPTKGKTNAAGRIATDIA
jgi:hypothetical protein